MEDREVDGFLKRVAPGDVQDSISWLTANGYALSSHRGDDTFRAQFVYTGGAEIVLTVDRSQWLLDVVARPGAEAWQYDLLIAAQVGKPCEEVFPAIAARSAEAPVPGQLPDGVSWRDTLPGILQWMKSAAGPEVQAADDRARQGRHRLMWPRKRRG